jgi:hypothetical protein
VTKNPIICDRFLDETTGGCKITGPYCRADSVLAVETDELKPETPTALECLESLDNVLNCE